jgi:hypothetical protein
MQRGQLLLGLTLCMLMGPAAWGQALRLGARTEGQPEAGVIRPVQPPAPDPWYTQYYGAMPKDPRTLVYERARFFAEQRQLRIASRAWFGLSVSRPLTTADVFFAERIPHWTSGSVNHPERWSFVPPAVIVYIGSEYSGNTR